jgi:hypothetical protein
MCQMLPLGIILAIMGAVKSAYIHRAWLLGLRFPLPANDLQLLGPSLLKMQS